MRRKITAIHPMGCICTDCRPRRLRQPRRVRVTVRPPRQRLLRGIALGWNAALFPLFLFGAGIAAPWWLVAAGLIGASASLAVAWRMPRTVTVTHVERPPVQWAAPATPPPPQRGR